MPEPLDPAAIMAEHRPIFDGRVSCAKCHKAHPCQTYRLAEALTEANRKLATVEAVLRPHDPLCMGRYEATHPCDCTSGKVRAALGGDQPMPDGRPDGYCVCDGWRPMRDCGIRAHRAAAYLLVQHDDDLANGGEPA